MWAKLSIQIERLSAWWCRAQHESLRWPLHGEYECATCYRRYPVPWAESPAARSSRTNPITCGDHHSVTLWAPPRHDSKGQLPVF
jgi:hypothetical protein